MGFHKHRPEVEKKKIQTSNFNFLIKFFSSGKNKVPHFGLKLAIFLAKGLLQGVKDLGQLNCFYYFIRFLIYCKIDESLSKIQLTL